MTVKNYKISFNYLKKFCEDKKQTIDFENITSDFAALYIPFLFDNGLQQNTVHKYIRDLKTFMNNAFERGFTTNLQHKFKAFSVAQKDTVQVYLSQDDLERLDTFDFSDNTILANTRDWLIVACSTGLRFMDFIQLTNEHIKTKKMPLKDEYYRVIDFETAKTDKPVSIPMTIFLDNCLQRNGGTFPPLPTPSVKSACVLLNARFKKVGKLVGLDEPVTITNTFFGKTTYTQKKKYELLKTHTGRRTVISNMLLAGFDPFKVTKTTGHKGLKMLSKYDRVTNEENAANLSQDPYFKPK
jgi:Phage integrase SAM-like domain/Phage integrase family